MNQTEKITKHVLPIIFALCAKYARAANAETITLNFKRDTTLVGTTDANRVTFLTAVNEALYNSTDEVTKKCFFVVGSASNGTNATTNSTQAATFRGFFRNVLTVRPDVAALFGSDATRIAEASGEKLDELMRKLKASPLEILDVECFMHKCTSNKTSKEYQNVLVGPAVRACVKYEAGKSALYTVSVNKIDASLLRAFKTIDNANAKLADERKKTADAKAKIKANAKAAK